MKYHLIFEYSLSVSVLFMSWSTWKYNSWVTYPCLHIFSLRAETWNSGTAVSVIWSNSLFLTGIDDFKHWSIILTEKCWKFTHLLSAPLHRRTFLCQQWMDVCQGSGVTILLITESLWAEVGNPVLIPTHQFFHPLRRYRGWGCCVLAQQEPVAFLSEPVHGHFSLVKGKREGV